MSLLTLFQNNLGAAVPLAGTVSATPALTASAQVKRSPIGSLGGAAAIAQAVSVQRPVAATLLASGMLTGRVLVSTPVSGAITGAGASAGILIPARPLSGLLASTGTWAGAADLRRSFGGSLPAASAISQAVSVQRPVAATLPGDVAIAAALLSSRTFIALLSGLGQFGADLSPIRRLTSTLDAGGQLTVSLHRSQLFRGQLPDAAGLAAAALVDRALIGLVPGDEAFAAILTDDLPGAHLLGILAGTGRLSAAISVDRALRGDLTAATDLAARLASARLLIAAMVATGAFSAQATIPIHGVPGLTVLKVSVDPPAVACFIDLLIVGASVDLPLVTVSATD